MTEPRLAALALGLCCACAAFEPTVGENQVPLERPPSEQPHVALDLPASEAREEGPDFAIDATAPPDQLPRVLPSSLLGDELFRLELREKSLAEAIHMIAEFGGVNIYLDAGLTRKIDASFPAVKLRDALQVILDQNELELVEDPPGVFWVLEHAAGERQRAQFRVQSVNLASISTILTEMVSEDTVVVTDPGQNLVVVNGSRSDIDMIGEYLRAADRLKRQVLIEARLVEVMLDEEFELGLSAALANQEVGDSTVTILQNFATPTDLFTIDFTNSDGDLTATLNALQSFIGLELISSPRVAAVNNSEALIEIVTEVPYIQTTNTTTTTADGAGNSSFQEVQFKEAGVKLKVTPVIQEDRVIELKVEQELSEVSDFFVGIPVLDTRTVNSTLQIKDRHTLVIGGLMQDSVSKTDTGVPLLMDIPWFGRLFRGDQDVKQKRELVLFLTPTIVDVADAEPVADTYREVFRSRRREMGLEAAGGGGEVHR